MKLSYVKDYERNSELMHTAPSKDESFTEDASGFLLVEEVSYHGAMLLCRAQFKRNKGS